MGGREGMWVAVGVGCLRVDQLLKDIGEQNRGF